jgi:hypothetical protein
MKLKWIEPESRLLMKLLFRRNFDTFTDSAQQTTNWLVLGFDIFVLWLLL